MPFSQGFIPDKKRIKQLEMLYSEFQKKLRNKLFEMNPYSYSKIKERKIIREIRESIMELNLRVLKWTRIATREAYLIAENVAVKRLQFMDKKKDKKFNPEIHDKTIDKGIELISNELLKANNKILKQVKVFFYWLRRSSDELDKLSSFQIQEFTQAEFDEIDEFIKSARISRMTLKEMSDEIQEKLENKIGKGNLIEIRGRHYQPKKYAVLVARTRLRAIQTQAIKNMCKQYENDLVAWSDHFMRIIDECEEFAGHVYSLSGKHPVYPALTDEPPIHPQCEHFLTPVSDEFFEIRNIRLVGNKIIT